jgi:hypothetical protein
MSAKDTGRARRTNTASVWRYRRSLWDGSIIRFQRRSTNFLIQFNAMRIATRKSEICASVYRKIMLSLAPSRRGSKGRMRIVTKRAAGCDGRDGVAGRAARVADGQSVWSRSPDAGIKFREAMTREATVAKTPGHRGERATGR